MRSLRTSTYAFHAATRVDGCQPFRPATVTSRWLRPGVSESGDRDANMFFICNKCTVVPHRTRMPAHVHRRAGGPGPVCPACGLGFESNSALHIHEEQCAMMDDLYNYAHGRYQHFSAHLEAFMNCSAHLTTKLYLCIVTVHN